MAYSAFTARDRGEMLQTIGVASVDELFADIAPDLRAQSHLDLPPTMSEMQVRSYMNALAARNAHADIAPCFLGAGYYDHYIPAVVPALAGRGEFATAYTPYQAETSQGTLQVIYEFQTLLCQLSGMEMANASLYDGATALAEAIIMAHVATKRPKVLLPRAVSPFWRQVVQSYVQGLPIEVVEVPFNDGTSSLDDCRALLGSDVAAIVVANPNFFGALEDARAVADLAHQNGALMIEIFNPATLGLLSSPGEHEADIAVGEGQPLGLAMQFGGPGLGLFCCRKKFARHAPGRLAGITTDAQGRPGFTLTLQTREQHIRREKATSNICSNQALCALTATIYLSSLGPQGMREVGGACFHKAHYAQEKLSQIAGVEPIFSAPFFHEFALQLPRPVSEINVALREAGITGPYDLSRDYPELPNAALFCCTEKRTREEIDTLTQTLAKVL